MFSFQTKLSMLRALVTKNSPFYIQFYVSKFCHLKCKMCNIVEANHDLTPFKSEHIEAIADNLVKIGAGVILLTGGEPYLRPDIDEIVKALKKRNLDVRLQTAGLYSKREKIIKCAEYGAKDINVSVDSLDEGLSDYINGRKGSWMDMVRTVSFVSRNFSNKGSICALGCVLSKYNVDEIEAILDFATEIGWWLSLVPVHITGINAPMNFRGYDEYFTFEKDDHKKIKELIKRLKIKKRQGSLLFDSNDYLDSIYHFISEGHPNWRRNGICDSPNLYFAIQPDGRFAPCCDYRLNEDVYLYDPKFPEIYKSENFRNQVRSITKACPGCNFGSFPEMTLSVSSWSTIKERCITQLRASSQGIKPLSEVELLEKIEKIKGMYPVYSSDRQISNREKKYWPKTSNISEKLWNNL